jgi:predicted molibdopterin-dependent oxidoreductase YjgC
MNRIEKHPILTGYDKGTRVSFEFDGKTLTGYEGEPIAMALKANGVMIHRYTSKYHEPRGMFCAIGRCTDCVMIVDGKPNVRTCVTALKDGMRVQTQDGLLAKTEAKP